MIKTIITADSTFDMVPEQVSKLGIEVIASYVRMDGDNVFDYPDVTMEQLFNYYKESGNLPQTAAASPYDYIEFFKQFESDDTKIIHIAKSSKMSSCYNHAVMAQDEVKNLMVFDSKSIAGGSAILAYAAAKARDNGLSAENIFDLLTKLSGHISGAFIVDQLEFLYKGGRCSAMSRLGANVLRLRPQINIIDGEMLVGKKYRGKFEKCLIDSIDDALSDLSSIDKEHIVISHTVQDKELLDAAVKHIESYNHFENITVQVAGSAVSCHCGPNTFGVFVLKK